VEHVANHAPPPAPDGWSRDDRLQAVDRNQERRDSTGAVSIDSFERDQGGSLSGAGLANTPSLASGVNERPRNHTVRQFLHRCDPHQRCSFCSDVPQAAPPRVAEASAVPKKKRRTGEDAGAARWAVGTSGGVCSALRRLSGRGLL
jgi:hypothetical protein